METGKNIIADDITELIGRTPMLRLNRLTAGSLHAEVLAKIESFNPGGSVKDCPCLDMIESAERDGRLKKGATVIEPTSGNTGIGLAMICAVRGYRCVLVMPESMSLEKTYLLRNYGAEVVLTPGRQGITGSIKKAEELAKKIPDSFICRQFENASNARAHRKTTAEEIWCACGGRLDCFVAGVGTGGTLTGIGEVLKERLPDVKVIAVEPENCAVLSGGDIGMHRIQGIGAGFIPPILNREIIDRVVRVNEKDAFRMTRRLGRIEGLSVGLSSGAAVVAAMELARELGPHRRVVTILCNTGERYFSMEQYFEA